MRLLRTLTLIYAGVLVSALATSLAAIWLLLRRVAETLGEVRAALQPVSDDTAPLGEHLQRLDDATTGAAGELTDGRARLEGANDRLAALAEQSRAAELTR